jgi:hypothetical protein
MQDYGHIFDNNGMTYSTYRKLIDDLLALGKTTGTDHSEAMLHYTKMNVQRMNRVEKNSVLSDELLATIDQLKGRYHFLVISEGWCGDAAQILPVIQRIVLASPEKFELKIVLRDENLSLMDRFLTNGGRAIPVLLVLDENKQLQLPKWGPRPSILQALLADWKKENTDPMLLAEKLHGWYAKDKTQTTQQELTSLLQQLS